MAAPDASNDAITTSIPTTTSSFFFLTSSDSDPFRTSDAYATSPPTTTSTSSTNDSSSYNNSKSGFANYYFIFIALFILVLSIAIWAFHRRRLRLYNESLQMQQHALSQDLQDNGAGQGWTYAANRATLWDTVGEAIGGLGGGRRRRGVEEGLDERGEAPPPYKPDADESEGVVARADDATEERTAAGTTLATGSEASGQRTSIPLRTLAREDVGRKPPDYSEAVAREMNTSDEEDDAGRGPSGSSGTAEERTTSSSTTLERNQRSP